MRDTLLAAACTCKPHQTGFNHGQRKQNNVQGKGRRKGHRKLKVQSREGDDHAENFIRTRAVAIDGDCLASNNELLGIHVRDDAARRHEPTGDGRVDRGHRALEEPREPALFFGRGGGKCARGFWF